MTKLKLLLCGILLTAVPLFSADKNETWMNPKIGFTGDFLVDISDVKEEWQRSTTEGIQIRSAELILGAAIDPYAELTANMNFSLEGVELHELYAHFPYIKGGFALNAGWKLAQFGRWNQFHTHSMPFTAEPRIYKEYFGGHFQGTGAELSWLTPLPFYVEATLFVYDGIEGHTHDNDPSPFESEYDLLAKQLGLTKHGSHWHSEDGEIVTEEDMQDPEAPVTEWSNREISSIPFGGRIKSVIEMGDNWSIDLGGSAVYQKAFRKSNRLDTTYAKALFGSDITFFWHPLQKNKYRNLDFGVEWLMNYEENEYPKTDTTITTSALWRQGLFGHIHYKHNGRWHFGTYGELFESQEVEPFTKKRFGLFTTYEISHYQYLRLEGSSYKQFEDLPPVHRLTLQYDVTIGFHSHGTLR